MTSAPYVGQPIVVEKHLFVPKMGNQSFQIDARQCRKPRLES